LCRFDIILQYIAGMVNAGGEHLPELVILATQIVGGLFGVLLARVLRRARLGNLGSLIVGIVGGVCGGLVAASYGFGAAALVNGEVAAPVGIAAQAAAGAAGGALFAVLTGLVTGRAAR
jgi:uncharacterized membrane protein YeaQ/YmgE (transglycosylase-associated protein family)